MNSWSIKKCTRLKPRSAYKHGWRMWSKASTPVELTCQGAIGERHRSDTRSRKLFRRRRRSASTCVLSIQIEILRYNTKKPSCAFRRIAWTVWESPKDAADTLRSTTTTMLNRSLYFIIQSLDKQNIGEAFFYHITIYVLGRVYFPLLKICLAAPLSIC